MGPLGELERHVMEVVWDHPPATVREVADRMRGDVDRAYTTVMTTLDRLHKKGLLLREKEALAWRYRPALARDAFQRVLVDALAARLLGERRDLGLAALVDAADAATLDRLAALIEARRRA